MTAETPGLTCRAPRRNAALEQAGLTAVDEVDVAVSAGGGATLTVFFTGPVPAGIAIDNVLITGGRPVKVTRARPAVNAAARPGSPVSPATTTPESAALADIGPTTR